MKVYLLWVIDESIENVEILLVVVRNRNINRVFYWWRSFSE